MHAEFLIQTLGTASLQVTRFTPITTCSSTSCIKCGDALLEKEELTLQFYFGGFTLPPLHSTKVSYSAEFSAATGFRATANWKDIAFPRNSMANWTSDPSISVWIVYLGGPLRDTGKIITDSLTSLYAFWSETMPEGAPLQIQGGDSVSKCSCLINAVYTIVQGFSCLLISTLFRSNLIA